MRQEIFSFFVKIFYFSSIPVLPRITGNDPERHKAGKSLMVSPAVDRVKKHPYRVQDNAGIFFLTFGSIILYTECVNLIANIFSPEKMMEKKSTADQKKGPTKQRLGELLLEFGHISSKQLQDALKRQTQVGGQLGSILIEMGMISVDDLLDFLSKQLGVPSANLFKLDIDQSVLKVLPVDKITSLKVLPIAVDDSTITLAMVNPQDFVTINELEFSLGRKIKPVVVPAYMMEAATRSIRSDTKKNLTGQTLGKVAKATREKMEKAPRLVSLLRYLVKSGASDMLFTAGAPPSIRIRNELKRLAMPLLTPGDCEKYAKELLPDSDWNKFLNKNDLDIGVTYPEIGRFRVNIYRQRNSISIALRPIVDTMPSFEELNLPEWLKAFCLKPQGLILVSGPAGHGKTTTLCAMVDYINACRRCNIITLEDPIEYLHNHQKSNINQREIGRDTPSFVVGIRHMFRQSPDVIVLGEMRDMETFEIALQAANTGHLVISTVHSDNSTSIIDRIINMSEPHQQGLIRMMLADSLLLSLAQRLIPRKNYQGRILAIEKLVNSYRVKNLIREEKARQIRAQLQVGAEDFTSMDVAIAELYNKGKIELEDGLMLAEDQTLFSELTGTTI